jgi:hypothetical protein
MGGANHELSVILHGARDYLLASGESAVLTVGGAFEKVEFL